MTPNQLKSRQRFVKATPLPNRASCKSAARRDENHIQKDESHSDSFDTFFEYEEELSELKPSNFYSDDTISNKFIEMEELDDDTAYELAPIKMDELSDEFFKNIDDSNSYIVMSDIDSDIKKNGNYMDVSGFDFIQCEHIKKDGNRCKRQAPKNSTICSSHKKMIEKNK